MPNDTVLAFVDYENIRISLQDHFVETVDIRTLVRAIRDVGATIGQLRGIRVYGDWTRRGFEARQFQDSGCQLVHVLRKRSKGDRSDMTMAFAIDDVCREEAGISACLVVSGDADFSAAILRGTEHGKKMHLSAISRTTARELLGQVEGFYPLEAVLQVTPIEPPEPLFEVPKPDEAQIRFIRRLHGLEKSLPYVVRGYFRSTIMENAPEWGETPQEQEDFIERAIADGLVETYEVPNPRIPGRQVVCLRLVKDNAVVRSVLS